MGRTSQLTRFTRKKWKKHKTPQTFRHPFLNFCLVKLHSLDYAPIKPPKVLGWHQWVSSGAQKNLNSRTCHQGFCLFTGERDSLLSNPNMFLFPWKKNNRFQGVPQLDRTMTYVSYECSPWLEIFADSYDPGCETIRRWYTYPSENMSSSVGMMTFPIYGKS